MNEEGKLEVSNFSMYPLIKPIFTMKISLNDFLYKKNRQQQIKGFYYAARHHSISEAARVMNLTQSTVTLQIQSLERDLDLKLFRRDSKPLSLTAAGEDFYATACPLMHEFESVIEKFLDKRNLKEQKTINIAVHHIAISYLMPRIISFFKKSNPESKIIVRNIAPKRISLIYFLKISLKMKVMLRRS